MKKYILLIIISFAIYSSYGQEIRLALMKYNGGGDWYSDPTALKNLVAFANQNLKTDIAENYDVVEPSSKDLYNYPYIHLTGHGNVIFSEQEVENIRKYLLSGGFLHIDDNYGLDKYIRREMKKVFPDKEFVELPFDHPIYHQFYNFDKGLPKIHLHDNKPPQGFAIMEKDVVLCFYTYECDLGDGWEDKEVHKDSDEKRLQALKMGANILQYVFMGKN